MSDRFTNPTRGFLQYGGSQQNSRFAGASRGAGQMFSSFFGSGRSQPAGRFSYSLGQSLGRFGTSGMGQGNRFSYAYTPMNLGQSTQTMNMPGGSQTTGGIGQWSGQVGKVAQPGPGQFGDFYKTPEVFGEIQAAAEKYGVPANFLMAIIAKESSGRWAENSQVAHARGMRIHGFIGVFENAAREWGFDFDRGIGNRAYQIEILAGGLRKWYDRLKAQNPSYDWLNVAAVHYSGDPTGASTPGDSWQHGSTQQYMQETKQFWDMLDQMSGVSSQGFAPAGTPPSGVGGFGSQAGAFAGGSPGQYSSGISTLWGGQGEKNLDYGWNAGNSLGLYEYGLAYGMDGRGHTGVDVGMELGSPYFSPVAGRVICACTGNGPECGAFNDYFGGGCGRIEVEMPNGHRVIFGHTSTSSVRLGDTIQVGQQLGTVGGMNGPHIHVEYRIPDASTGSGWRIVDPIQYLGGAGVPGIPGGTPGGASGAGQSVTTRSPIWGYMRDPYAGIRSSFGSGGMVSGYMRTR